MNTEDIFERIKNCINKQYLEFVEIVLRESNNKNENAYYIVAIASPSLWRPNKSEKTLAKIKVGKNVSFIAFKKTYKKKFEKKDIDYTTIKSEDFIRITFEEFNSIDKQVLNQIINDVLLESFSFSPFGCCGKYKECQEKHFCVHSDQLYSTACQFKKFIV